MFERRHQPLVPLRVFLGRLVRALLLAMAVVLGGLAIGAAGYHWLDGFPWLDAVLNAAMILSGMGPVDPIITTPGKIFATVYALFSGFVFLTIGAILFAPLFHRMVHRFHVETDEDDTGR
jgi:hypothetical protein